MPKNISVAIDFLESQWYSTNENKIKGILAEIRFRELVKQLGLHTSPGGWILTPGKPDYAPVPAHRRVCVLPLRHRFSWEAGGIAHEPTPGQIAAYILFRQLELKTYFLRPASVDEAKFDGATRSQTRSGVVYKRPYELTLFEIGPDGIEKPAEPREVFSAFPRRMGAMGMQSHRVGRLSRAMHPWSDSGVVAGLFWAEYARYYFQVDYLIANNDLDMFVIGPSGLPYPIELKSKRVARDPQNGDWFGIDMGPFAKLSLFSRGALLADALYVVEEVDETGVLVGWYAIRFSDLVKSCSWVGQSGGTGMKGGSSSTFKVPKAAFTQFSELVKSL